MDLNGKTGPSPIRSSAYKTKKGARPTGQRKKGSAPKGGRLGSFGVGKSTIRQLGWQKIHAEDFHLLGEKCAQEKN